MSKKFIKSTILITVSLLIIISGFNYIIDPYDIYRAQIVTLKKHIPYGTLRLHKAHAISRVKPQTLISGSSRTQQGFDPESQNFQYKPVYNMGIVRTNIYETYRYIQHAAAKNNIKQLFLTLDLFSFNANLRPRSDFEEERLSVTKDGYSQNNIHSDLLSSLLSFSAIKASLSTIVDKDLIDKPIIDLNGMRNQQALYNEIMKYGHRKSAQIIETQFASAILFPPPTKSFSFNDKINNTTTFDIFEKLIEFCHNNDIETYIALNPSHARMYEVYYQRGLWNQFEDWKRNLLKINTKVSKRLKKPPYPLWDFTGYNQITTEPLPSIKQTDKEMKYFWETSHFKSVVGELMIERMLNKEHTKDFAVNNFGTQLFSNNIESHLIEIRNARNNYIRLFADELKDLNQSMIEINTLFKNIEQRKSTKNHQ